MYQIYGTMLCKDCVACVDALKATGVAFAFHDIGNDLDNLKVFLRLRDQSPLFDEVKSNLAARLAEEVGSVTPEQRKTIMMEDVL